MRPRNAIWLFLFAAMSCAPEVFISGFDVAKKNAPKKETSSLVSTTEGDTSEDASDDLP